MAYYKTKSEIESIYQLLTEFFTILLKGAIAESIRVWFSNQRYQNKRKLTQAGFHTAEPVPKKKKSSACQVTEGDYKPPSNDDLATQRHLQALEREEKSKNRRQEVVTTLMHETQLYREAEICSIEASKRVKEIMHKYKCLYNPTEVRMLKFHLLHG